MKSTQSTFYVVGDGDRVAAEIQKMIEKGFRVVTMTATQAFDSRGPGLKEIQVLGVIEPVEVEEASQ